MRAVVLLLFMALCAPATASERYGVLGVIDREWVSGLTPLREMDQRLTRALMSLQSASPRLRTVRDDACGCVANYDGRIIDPVSCPAVFRAGRENGARVQAAPVVDFSAIARHMACFREGLPACRTQAGQQFVGEGCCAQEDLVYRRVRGDLHFYVLLPAPIAERVRDFQYGESPDMRRLEESCSIHVDEARRLWTLGPAARGFHARMWLYAARHYGATTPDTVARLARTAEGEPPSPGEAARARALGMGQAGRWQDVTIEMEQARDR